MRSVRSILLVMLTALLLPAAGAAQAQFRGVEASVGYAGWTGDNVGSLEPGVRTRLTLFGQASRGLGVGLTGVWGQVPLDGLDDNANEWGLGVTLRQALGDRDRTHVFVEGYVGWSRVGVDLGDDSPDQTEDGLAVGPGVGVEFPLGPRAALVLSGDFHYHSYDQIRFGSGMGAESDDAGWRYGAQLGFHLSLGS